MTDTSTPSTERPSHPPLWLVEGLDIVEQRRSVLIAVALGVIALGGILAVLAPGLVPPVPIVGAAVGLAALLLGLAVAVALDATDLRLRGPRHVGAAGGELVAVLPTRAERPGAETLADAVLEARVPGSPLLLGLAASGRDIRPTVAWTDALATALEAEGVSVLRIDLASGHTRSAGLLEVVQDGVKLASAVTFGPEPKVARLGAGADLTAALGALSLLPGRLPRDLDVLLVALPMAATGPVVTAVRSLDHVLIVAQRDRTSRVELIAGLDALEAAGTRAQVALLDDRTAARLAPRSDAPAPEVVPDAADEPGSASPPLATTDAVAPPPAAGSTPDHGPPAPQHSERREVEVVHGAAEAAAIALVQFPVGLTFDPDDVAAVADGALPVGRTVPLPAASARDLPPAPVTLDMPADPAEPADPADPVEPDEPDAGDRSGPVAAETAPTGDTGEATPDAAGPDDADELEAIEPAGAIGASDADHAETMRTTAQLSGLLDDLEAGGDEPPPDTP